MSCAAAVAHRTADRSQGWEGSCILIHGGLIALLLVIAISDGK